jgi:hypothetical protein
VAGQLGRRECEGGSHRHELAPVLGRDVEQAAGGVQLSELSDSAGDGQDQQDRGGHREHQKAEQVGQVVHALLAVGAGLGHVAAGALAGVAQRVRHVASHDGYAVRRVGGAREAVLHHLAGVVHARAEHGELVHGVVDLEAEPGQDDQGEDDERVLRYCPSAVVCCVGIEAHTARLPGSTW